VDAGLHALEELGEAIERWLREDVATAYDAMKTDPKRGLPAKKAFTEIKAKHSRS
jgi:antitoxin ParD1/3/4